MDCIKTAISCKKNIISKEKQYIIYLLYGGNITLKNMTDLKRDCRTIKIKIENIGKTRTKKVAKI